jgi:membrane peptidoglycan carboxypeptidase
VKNLVVGEDEMIVASRVEHTLSKAEILELYLNSVYLGRSSWVDRARRPQLFRQAGKGAHAKLPVLSG